MSQERTEGSARTQAIRERRFLVALLIFLLVSAVWLTRVFVSWALFGLVLAYMLRTPYLLLVRWIGDRPRVAAAAMVTAVAVVLAVVLVWLVYTILDDARRLAESIEGDGLEAKLRSVIEPMVGAAAPRYAEAMVERLHKAGFDLLPYLVDITVQIGVGIFVLGGFLYAGLVHGDRITAWVWEALPLREDRERRLLNEIGRSVDAVFYGLVLVGFVQGVAGGLLWWFVGLPSPVFWGAIMFVIGMIPSLGPIIVLGPGAVYLFFEGRMTDAVIMFVGAMVAVGPLDNVMRPWLVGKKGGLPGPLVLLSVVGGVTALGPIGIFVGPMVFAVAIKVVELAQETRKVAPAGVTSEDTGGRDPSGDAK